MRRFVVCFAIVVLASGCWPQSSAGPVFVAPASAIDVLDGDSLVVKHGRNEVEIRLYGIDAPEYRQPWSEQARAALRKLVARHALRIEEVERDRYDRIVARVYRDDDDLFVNADMVRGGHAWVYRRYTDDRELIALEKLARKARTGLWRLPASQRIEPWEWRKQHEHQN